MDKIKWTIGICDDEELCRENIQKLCMKYGISENIEINFKMFKNGQETLNHKGKLDILFLDIELGDTGGLDIIGDLRNADTIWRIILATRHDEEALNGYGSKTIGFLTKPLTADKVFYCLNIAKKEFMKNKTLCFLSGGSNRVEQLENILFLEGTKNYVRIVTAGDCFLTYGTEKYWEEQLKNYGFIRIHRSYLVNMKHINFFSESNHTIHIRNTDICLPIGKTYRQAIQTMLDSYRLSRAQKWETQP